MKQRFEEKNERIRAAFEEMKRQKPERLKRRLTFSWSNWGFGLEDLERSCERLQRAGIHFIELHGNHYGPDLGYDAAKTLHALRAYGIRVAGVCGMFSADNDLSSNRPRSVRRRSIIYEERRPLPRRWGEPTCSYVRRR